MLIDVTILIFCVVLLFLLWGQHLQKAETREQNLYLNVLIENQAKCLENDERSLLILENMYELLDGMSESLFAEPHTEVPAKAS